VRARGLLHSLAVDFSTYTWQYTHSCCRFASRGRLRRCSHSVLYGLLLQRHHRMGHLLLLRLVHHTAAVDDVQQLIRHPGSTTRSRSRSRPRPRSSPVSRADYTKLDGTVTHNDYFTNVDVRRKSQCQLHGQEMFKVRGKTTCNNLSRDQRHAEGDS